MSAYNTVSAEIACPSCSSQVKVNVQFKYGNTWQLRYEVGDNLKWGGNDVGERGLRHVVVDGVVEDACPKCNYGKEWNVYVDVERDRITRVENANGRFDFAKVGSNYIPIEV